MVLKVLIVAVVVERVWEHFQLVIGDKLNSRLKVLGSAVLAVTAAVSLELDLLYGLDVMAAVSIPGMVLTGFVLGLGSNVVHDVIDIVASFGKER